MAKKKKVTVQLGLNDLITQPRKMSRLPALDSRIGIRTMLAILQRLQGLFNLAKSQERDPQLYMKFPTDEFEVKQKTTSAFNEGDVLFRLNLSDIAEPNHYPEVRAALSDLLKIKVLVPVPDEPGEYRTESLMDIKGRVDADMKFVGTSFEVIIPRITAENILDINLLGGYSRFLLFTASQFRSEYAYTLYIRLSDEWRRHGDIFEIDYEDLRRNMGFVKEQKTILDKNGRETKVIIDHTTKHASWSLFCKYILNQAQQELRSMADREPPVTDFTFEYEGRLNGGPLPAYKRPDVVRFTIIPTSVGKQLAIDSNFAAQSIQARRMMTAVFNLTEGQARTLMRRVTPDKVDELLRKMQTWKEDIEAGRRKTYNRAAWAWTCIDDFLRTPSEPSFTPAEEVTATSATHDGATAASSTTNGSPSISEVPSSLLAALRAARTGHLDEGDKYFGETLSKLRVDAGGKTLLLEDSVLTAAVEWYWNPDDFRRIAEEYGLKV